MTAKSTTTTERVSRLIDIDQAKGLAIVLVVFGHIVSRGLRPVGADWYFVAVHHLYTFHMAFFFFLSGFVYFYRSRMPMTISSYLCDAKNRFLRLAPGYFLLATIVFFGKYFAQQLMHVDREVSLDVSELVTFLLYPTVSYVSFLWFIFVLYLLYLLVPLVFWLAQRKSWLVVGMSALLFFVPLGDFLALNQVGHYLLFFVLGNLAVTNLHRYYYLVDRWWIIWLACFAAILAYVPYNWLPLVAGLVSIPALHGLTRMLPRAVGSLLLNIGLMVFSIYLFNTISIGLVKAVLLRFVSWDGANFMLFVPILLIAGLLIPMGLKYFIIRRVPVFDRIV